jgi:nitroreductase
MHLDAGHVCQNLYLAAAAIGCGCCAIAAFDDVAMAEALRLDPAEEFVIYLATVGMME